MCDLVAIFWMQSNKRINIFGEDKVKINLLETNSTVLNNNEFYMLMVGLSNPFSLYWIALNILYFVINSYWFWLFY